MGLFLICAASLGLAAAGADPGGPAKPSPVPADRGAATERYTPYTVGPKSSARYIVHALNFFVPETVHGREGRISGEIRLFEGVSPTVTGILKIDPVTLKSGNTTRDGKVQDIVHAKDHPAIVFTLVSVDPFSMHLLDTSGVTVTAHGSLTVADASVPLNFPVFAVRSGGKHLHVEGMALTGFKDLKLQKPGMAFLVMMSDAIEAGALIEADQTLKQPGRAAP
ncbi:MAG TPA: YceI family protein [bacterium]|nr:YceI family protein [bacterium]